MHGFSEQNVDITNDSSVVSSIAFSKCTQFFNNCLGQLSLIITQSRAKLKVIISENYCNRYRPTRYMSRGRSHVTIIRSHGI